MAEETFIDDDPPERYTITNNELIEAPELTPQASFWLIYLKSKPKGWKPNVKQLTGAKAVGRTAVESALKELIEHGYMRREVQRDQGRIVGQHYRFSWEARWKNDPTRFGLRAGKTRSQTSEASRPEPGSPEPGNPVTANPQPVDPQPVDQPVVSTVLEQVLEEVTTEGPSDLRADASGDDAEATPAGEPRHERDRIWNALTALYPDTTKEIRGKTVTAIGDAGFTGADVLTLAWLLGCHHKGAATIHNLRNTVAHQDRDEVALLGPYREQAVAIVEAAFEAHAAGKIPHLGAKGHRPTAQLVVAQLLATGRDERTVKQAMRGEGCWTFNALVFWIDHPETRDSSGEPRKSFRQQDREDDDRAFEGALAKRRQLLAERAAGELPPATPSLALTQR